MTLTPSLSFPGQAARPEALIAQPAEGGTTTMPFGATFFSAGPGLCRDRSGTRWMVQTGDPRTTGEI